MANVRAHAGESPPRLLLRFALYSGAVLAAAGLAIVWIVDRQVADRAERTVEARARMVAEDTLRRQLRPSDFAAPVSAGRRSELDRLVRTRTLIPGVVGVRLVNRDGTITYAALHRLIGTHAPYRRDLAGVFEGVAKRRVTETTTWRGQRNVKVLQAVIPVQMPASRRAIGALELDQNYDAIEVSTAGARNRLALILAAAFLALYIALFPILRRVTRELEARNRGLRERAVEREQLLAAERAARSEAESVQRLLTEQNDRLRELDRMKDEFVSLVSHQLRTPLTSIRGYVELLLEDGAALTPDHQRFLTVVDRNAHRLLELVGDLLFLAQVLDNLVANAIKFTGDGGRVTVTLATSGDRALVTVADTGPGISAADLEKIFERFYRSASATAHGIPGSGLGLPIAKAIIDGHGGRIAVASEEGRGTTVRLELPLAVPRTRRARELQRAAR